MLTTNDDTLIKVELTSSQLENLITFVEVEFIDSIRRDEEIDNIDYVIDMSEAIKALRSAKAGASRDEIKTDESKTIPYRDWINKKLEVTCEIE